MAQNKDARWWREQRPEKEWKVYEDFRYFLYLVWKHLMLPDPTPVQYDLADYLQHGPRRFVIMAFRGVGKSWITSAYVNWLLLRDPNMKIMVVSASKERADQFSTFTLRPIQEMPLLQHLAPESHQRQSKIAFDVGPARADHSPSVKSVGIFGQLTGSRADVIIADDCEVPNNSETQGMRDKLAERVKEFDAVIKPGETRIGYLGTPQCEDSLYNQLPTRGYEIRIWPSRYPNAEAVKRVYGERLAPFLLSHVEKDPSLQNQWGDRGAPTDPLRFNHEDLMERELSYGRSGFALQFMLDTRLSDQDRYPLKLDDLVVMRLNGEVAPQKIIWSAEPKTVVQDIECVGLNGDRYHRPAETFGDWCEYNGSVMFIDPSGRGQDETAYAVVKMLNGYLFVTAAGGMKSGYGPETLTALCELAKAEKVNRILIESNFGDGMFTQLLNPYLYRIYPCTTEEVRHQKQKELRIIDTLEPVMNQHRLIIDQKVIENDYRSTRDLPPEKALKMQLFYQMSRVTRDRGALAYDDRLDALAGAVSYWAEQMGADEDRSMAARKEQLLDAELAVFTGRAGMSMDLLAMGASPEIAMRYAGGHHHDTWVETHDNEQ